MSFQRNQVLFRRARWRRRILVPLWTVQAALSFAIVGIFSYRLAHTVAHFERDRDTVELVWESTNVGLGLLCVILTGLEVHRLIAATLTPFFLLACNVLKMTAACAILALDIVVFTRRSAGYWSAIGLALDVAALAAMLTLGVYSIVAFRRLSRTNDLEDDLDGGVGQHMQHSLGEYGPYSEVYGRAYGRNTSADVGREGLSLAGHAAAMGTARAAPYDPYDAYKVHRAPHEVAAPRRVSYSHVRDTQFDAYRGSTALDTDTINRALDAELWGPSTHGAGLRPVSGSGAAAAAVDRSNSLVGTGVVVEATAVQRAPVNRMTSYSAEHADSVPDGAAGHAAPMIHELDETPTGSKGKAAAAQEKSALLPPHEGDPDFS